MEIVDTMLIDLSTLRAATGDFAEGNKLGEGEFGAVYKVGKCNRHLLEVNRIESWRLLVTEAALAY